MNPTMERWIGSDRPVPTLVIVVLVLALALAGCTSDDGPVEPTDDGDQSEIDDPDAGVDTDEPEPDDTDEPDGSTDPDGSATSEQPEEQPLPTTTFEAFPLDRLRTEYEVRVAEIIIEFDGELTDDGTLLTLEEPILFEFDSSQLKGGARTTLDDIAEVLDYYADAPIEVIGHTDDQGSADYNLDLSQRRADAVVAALIERGIDDGRITADGRGLTEPVASNDTDDGRAQNRRVEVLIVGVEPPEGDG